MAIMLTSLALAVFLAPAWSAQAVELKLSALEKAAIHLNLAILYARRLRS